MTADALPELPTLREAKNQVCIDGLTNRTLDAVLSDSSPDGVMATLTAFAHECIERGYEQGRKDEMACFGEPVGWFRAADANPDEPWEALHANILHEARPPSRPNDWTHRLYARKDGK